jgi:hypothetical protein
VTKRLLVIAAILILCAAGAYGLYYISPYGRHDRQAAAYERALRARVKALGDVRVMSGSSKVSNNRWGNGGECSFLATLKVSTAMTEHTFEQRLDAALKPYTDEYLELRVTQVGDKAGRRVLRIEAGTLGEGGSLDLRCG